MQYDLGKVSITPKGVYSSSTTYTEKDCVYYQGASYVCISETPIIGRTPSATSTYWALFAGNVITVRSLPDPATVPFGQLVCLVDSYSYGYEQ